MTNSITKHVTGIHAANGIRMLRSGCGDVVFLVEGGVDRSILWVVFEIKESQVCIAEGKENLEQARASLLKFPVDGVIVIRDRDFDDVQPSAEEPYVIVTDDYDLESCFLRNGCLEKLIGGFALQKRVADKYGNLQLAALEIACRAASFGAALKGFQTRSVPADFDGLKCSHIDKTSFEEDIGALLIAVRNKSVNCIAEVEAVRAGVRADMEAAPAEDAYPWHYARSCDVYDVLSHALRKRLADLSAAECSRATLQRALISVAHMSHITGTAFYHRLHALALSMTKFKFSSALLLNPT